jgi:hypothetical protein
MAKLMDSPKEQSMAKLMDSSKEQSMANLMHDSPKEHLMAKLTDSQKEQLMAMLMESPKAVEERRVQSKKGERKSSPQSRAYEQNELEQRSAPLAT